MDTTDTTDYVNHNFPEMSSYLEKVSKVQVGDQNLDLIDYDLFTKDDPDRIIVNNKLTDKQPFSSLKESKAFASFAGLAIGDALGCFLEGAPLRYDRNYLQGLENVSSVIKSGEMDILRCQPGQFTDDTSLALCIADSLIKNNLEYNGKDLCYRFFHWFFSGYNNGRNNEEDITQRYSTGIGGATYNALLDFAYFQHEKVASDGKDNGNGSIMRLAPIPIAFSHDLQKCMEYAAEQSYTTHSGEEASECSRLLSFILWNFLNIDSKEECKKFLEEMGTSFKTKNSAVECLAKSLREEEESLSRYDHRFNKTIEDRDWNWKNPQYKYSSYRVEKCSILMGIYCMDATAMALHIVYHSQSFKEAILTAVNLGGDADTVGAIVGMLAGALFGFDEDVRKWYMGYVAKWDDQKCAIRAYKLLKLSQEAEKKKMN